MRATATYVRWAPARWRPTGASTPSGGRQHGRGLQLPRPRRQARSAVRRTRLPPRGLEAQVVRAGVDVRLAVVLDRAGHVIGRKLPADDEAGDVVAAGVVIGLRGFERDL